ncbi:MAG: hypothetical protein L0229_14080 [Blastocatellia bacterium]|nr:hypothetical protein [Blastocatellia bacterium]
MKIEVVGPLIFWSLMFVVGAAIKVFTFGSTTVWFEIQPSVSLWATGVLFSLAVSERTYFRAKLVTQISRKPTGAGIIVDYVVTLPDELDFTPKFMYLFLIGVAIWILTLLLSGYALGVYSSSHSLSLGGLLAISISVLLASGITIAAVRTLNEVSK